MSEWKSVTRTDHCPICDGADNCKVSADGGAVWCGRKDGVSGRTNAGGQHLHILRDQQDRDWWQHPSHNATSNGHMSNNGKPPANYAVMVKADTEDARHQRDSLAESLGVSSDVLAALGIGFSDIGGPCWTFPERDARGAIVGINRRFASGEKKSIGNRGLTYARQWDHGGPVLLAEGGSDVAALMTMGLSAIGRPSNVGGVELLADFIRLDSGIPLGRPIIVIGEHDRLKNGQPRRSHAEHGDRCECGQCFPGLFGAKTVSERLEELLGRVIDSAMPPDGAKDSRAWLNAQGDVEPSALGRRFVDGLRRIASRKLPHIVSLEQLIEENPTLSPPVIDGLFRREEVVNVIAKSKVGKSWFTYGMALCVASGSEWLGRFRTTRGRVLLIDNELPKAVLAHRIPQVQAALQIPNELIRGQIDTLSLRENLMSIMDLEQLFRAIGRDKYAMIMLDAMYRMLPDGMSENDNAAMAQVYNQINRYCALTGAAIAIVHHSTKGSQDSKDVVDVGAGAGSQSRAADTHLVLRAHADPDAAVLEAAVRSFAPVDPLGIRWCFPVWMPDENLDPEKLKGKKPPREDQQQTKDTQAFELILEKIQSNGPSTVRKLIGYTGISRQRLERLLGQLHSKNRVTSRTVKIRGNDCEEYLPA